VSKEGERFRTSKEILNICGLLKDMFEDNDDMTEDVPLSNIPSKFLRDILEYCEHYNFKKEINIPTPLPSSSLA
jgi:hypothetical protein